jgi:hypothetical protein
MELLITFLNFSEDLRNFCGLRTVPDPSFFSQFKQDYADDIEAFFHKLVDITEPICQKLGESLTIKIFKSLSICIGILACNDFIFSIVARSNLSLFSTVMTQIEINKWF